jgi:hypothetical protein
VWNLWDNGTINKPLSGGGEEGKMSCLEPWLPCKVNQLAGIPSAREIQIGKICFLILAFNISVLLQPFHCDIIAEERYNYILHSALVAAKVQRAVEP